MADMTVEQALAFRVITRGDSTPDEIEARMFLMRELMTLRAELDGLRRDAVLVAVYDAVSRANLTRDLKSPERKAQIVRTAMQESSHEP